MNATELRIGNWCKIIDAPFGYESENGEVQIEAITIHYFESGEDLTLYPIPLTEEWLERFGGSKESAHSSGYRLSLEFEIYEDRDNDKTYWWFCFADGNCKVHEISRMEYVHQLQNLYFALTGTELDLINI